MTVALALRDRLECGVALEEIERDDDVFVEEFWLSLPKNADRCRA